MISYKELNFEELSKPQVAIGNYYLDPVRRMAAPNTDNFDVGFFPRARGLRNQEDDQVAIEASLRGQGAPPSRQDYSYVRTFDQETFKTDVAPEDIRYVAWQGDAEQTRIAGRKISHLKQPPIFERPFLRAQDTNHIIFDEINRGGMHTRNILKDNHVSKSV